MQFTIEECSDPAIRKELEALLRLGDLSQVVRAWVRADRACSVDSGWDDDTGAKRVYLAFEQEKREVGVAYAAAEDAVKDYPRASDVVAPPYRITNHRPADAPDEVSFRNTMEKLLVPEYDDFLASFVSEPGSVMTSAVGLALGHGDTRFEYLSDFLLEDSTPEDAEFYGANYLSVMCRRWNEDSNACEMWDYYVDYTTVDVH